MDKKDIIKKLLNDHVQGLTIEELSSRGKMNRITVVKILEGFLGAGLITQRVIGAAKLNYWKFDKE